MFIRKQKKQGKTYYSLVHNYREGYEVKQLAIGLGTKPSLNDLKWGTHHDFFERQLGRSYLASKEQILTRNELYSRYPELFKKEQIEFFKRLASASDFFEKRAGAFDEVMGTGIILNSPHEVLGVDIDASQKEIKTRYIELVKKIHPDVGGDRQLFISIDQAYKQLKNT